MRRIGMYLIGVVMLCAGSGHGYDPAMHMYIGSQTFDVWEDFDPAFYSLLNSPSYRGMMTRKFYYIGLVLPDILSPETQSKIGTLLNGLHSMRGEFVRPKLGALYIEDWTFNNVQLPITFDPNPHADITKIREMAEWARAQDWDYGFDGYQRALIYGVELVWNCGIGVRELVSRNWCQWELVSVLCNSLNFRIL